ncbi:MAG: chromosomal replication initiator protein DnaA [Actinobacteria bacterium]|nr:chromosomal replication initiator protein DnaA [Actinomycetota bacterium]
MAGQDPADDRSAWAGAAVDPGSAEPEDDGAAGSSPALDLESLWRSSLDEVVRTVSSPAQRQWLAATRPVGFSDDTVVLATPHAFAREWLDTRCGDRIRSALSSAAGRPLTVVITVQPKPEPLDGYSGPGAGATAEGRSDGPSDPPPSSDARTPDVTPAAGAPGADPTPLQHAPPQRTEAEQVPVQQPRDWDDGDHAAEHRERAESDRPLEAPGRPPGPTVTLPPQRPAIGLDDVEPDTQLNPKYVFDDFVIGASNRFAHAAAVAVAEAPAKSYNPLFIYGGAGLGKTHLLHAIGHYVRSLYPRLKVRYVTTEQFTNEFINAIRDDRITGFQRTYRQADVLLIDDIQFLESKERTQEEFFHTFNALHNAEKQIVISSDRPPRGIARLEDRLRSRFEWGLMTDVQPPDLETRIAILRKKSENDRLGVPPDVLELIASKVQSNIRELEGALIRVTAFASLQQANADLPMAEMVLKDLFPDDREQEISTQLIMEEVSAYFSLSVEELCSPSRSRQLVTARQIAMYLVREMTDLSLPRIGKAFGGRDHTTVMHANSKIANLMQERRAIYDQVQELTNRIKTRARTA